MLEPFDPYLRSWRWPAIALLGALAMLAAAHAFERFALLAPCPLCLRQREVYWAVAAMTATAIILWQIRQNPRFIMAFNVMLGLLFATGAVVAGYHAGVELGLLPAPSGCAAGAVDVNAIVFDGLDQRQATASCTDIPWSFLGLSMAGWNMLISLGFAAISFRAALVSVEPSLTLDAAE
ncbi:MAG: disulfide bond formation protein B [Pseudomonadota bacterium]